MLHPIVTSLASQATATELCAVGKKHNTDVTYIYLLNVPFPRGFSPQNLCNNRIRVKATHYYRGISPVLDKKGLSTVQCRLSGAKLSVFLDCL